MRKSKTRKSKLKRLTLIRHADAIAVTMLQLDKNRSLNAHGAKDAFNLGAELRTRNFSADLILCSSAVRTRETLTHIAGGYEKPFSTNVSFLDSLYNADAKTILETANQSGAEHVVVIGHNPGIAELVNSLASESASVPQEFKHGYFMPCMLAGFDLSDEKTIMDMFISAQHIELMAA